MWWHICEHEDGMWCTLVYFIFFADEIDQSASHAVELERGSWAAALQPGTRNCNALDRKTMQYIVRTLKKIIRISLHAASRIFVETAHPLRHPTLILSKGSASCWLYSKLPCSVVQCPLLSPLALSFFFALCVLSLVLPAYGWNENEPTWLDLIFLTTTRLRAMAGV